MRFLRIYQQFLRTSTRSSSSQGVDISTLLGLLPVQTESNPAMLCYTRTTDFPEKEQAEVKVDLRGAACKTLQLVSPTANSKMSCGNIRSSSQIPSMSIYSLWLLTSGMVSSGSKPPQEIFIRDLKWSLAMSNHYRDCQFLSQRIS